jgi:hypothetical protein
LQKPIKVVDMKHTLLAFLLLAVVVNCVAQTTLKFCVETGKDGTCKKQASEFTISKDGGTITFELKSHAPLETDKVRYKIFKLSEDGKEVFNNTIEQEIQGKWNYAWEEAVFYDPGTYKVMVYDKTDNLLCLSILKIFTQ